MSTPQSNDEFERLRQLLALKRHEQPPPGYFQNFSHQVMARINAVEGDAESAWVLRLWNYLTARPLWSGMAAAGACALVVGGLMLFRTPDPTVANTLIPNDGALGGRISSPAAMGNAPAFANQLAQPSHAAGETVAEPNSTNPVAAAPNHPSLFFTPKLQVDRASFSPAQ